MKQKELEEKQAAMSDNELIKIAENQVIELARTGGKSFKMCVPVRVTDTDMILSEIIKRYKRSVTSAKTFKTGGYLRWVR